MAIMEKGPFGNFTGKIGNVVGYQRGGKQFIRNRPIKKKTGHSPVRIAQMAKFGLMIKFLNPLRQFMNEAHKKTFKNSSGYDNLSSLNMVHIVTGDYRDFRIDYHKLVITKGSLAPPRDATVACARQGKLVFTWYESIGQMNELPTDRVFVIIYDEETKSWEIFENAATREDGKCSIDLAGCRGHLLQSYIGFIASNGLRVSNNRYLGMMIV